MSNEAMCEIPADFEKIGQLDNGAVDIYIAPNFCMRNDFYEPKIFIDGCCINRLVSLDDIQLGFVFHDLDSTGKAINLIRAYLEPDY